VYKATSRAKRGRKYKYKVRKNRRKGYRRRHTKQLAVKTQKRLLRRLEKAKRSMQYNFIKQIRPAAVLSPLHFRRPTTRITVTAEDKER
jgi:hypothetical protein